MIFGLMAYTAHPAEMPCDVTPGIYAIHREVAGGVFQNSECKLGAWVAWVPETRTLVVSKLQFKAGLLLGAIAGYAQYPILPLAAPSVAARWADNPWIRATALPAVKGISTGGVHLSIEWEF